MLPETRRSSYILPEVASVKPEVNQTTGNEAKNGWFMNQKDASFHKR